jgi:hypothetical protein
MTPRMRIVALATVALVAFGMVTESAGATVRIEVARRMTAGSHGVATGLLSQEHPGAKALLEREVDARWGTIAKSGIRGKQARFYFLVPRDARNLRLRVTIVKDGVVLGSSRAGKVTVDTLLPANHPRAPVQHHEDGAGLWTQLLLLVLGGVFGVVLAAFVTDPLQRLGATVSGGLMSPGRDSLAGHWKLNYWYEAGGDQRTGEQIMRVRQIGNWVTARTRACSGPQGHRVQGRVENRIFTATWDCLAEGASQKGMLQLIVSPGYGRMKGQWVGPIDGDAISSDQSTWMRLDSDEVEREIRRLRNARDGRHQLSSSAAQNEPRG